MEKIKISKKELEDIYDITDAVKPVEEEKEEDKNFTFEEYTESYDKEQLKEFKEDAT